MRSLKFAALIAASWLVMPTQAQQLSGESSLLPEANYSNSEVTVEQVPVIRLALKLPARPI